MVEFEQNRCYACKKLFCCVDCCTNHIRNKHPGRKSECPLCQTEILIVRNFENPQFLCHVIINHLPLECQSCGDLFENSSDLKALGTCTRRLLLKKIHDNGSYTPSPLIKTPLNIACHKKGFSIEGDCNSNFESLTSPPEFTRHTSTPMHIGLSRQNNNIIFKTPKSPNFLLKTPKTTPTSIPKINVRNDQFGIDRNKNICSTSKTLSSPRNVLHEEDSLEQTGSIYLSFSPTTNSNYPEKVSLKSILMADNNSSRSNSSKKIDNVASCQVKVEKDETGEQSSADMDLTDPQGLYLSSSCKRIHSHENVRTPIEVITREPRESKDCGKRVRFSDQFDLKEENEPMGSLNKSTTDTDEFFEARQSLSEFSFNTCPDKNTADNEKKEIIKQQYENKENISDSIKEIHKSMINLKKNSDRYEANDEAEKSVKSHTSDTSRVIMMVLVEQTGNNSKIDLTPLINSGMESLQSSAASLRQETIDIVSVDSYRRTTSSVQYGAPSLSTGRQDIEKTFKNNDKCETTTGGLFSAVANAVKTAFKNFSEVVSSKPISGEDETGRISPAVEALANESRSATQSFARRLKRSRDDGTSFEATESGSDDSYDIRSPEQKRKRAWYREIRGRDPIARMKNNNPLPSTIRGITSEVQSFQQGSLSVGDTILPLPSRAHQSTQTEPQ